VSLNSDPAEATAASLASTPIVMVYVSCPPAAAEGLAAQLVEARLAACINILPAVRSVYRWSGAVQCDDEALLVIKTRADRLDALQAAVLREHPYELPEFLVVPVIAGHQDYLQWIQDSVA